MGCNKSRSGTDWIRSVHALLCGGFFVVTLNACTGQLPGSFRFKQLEENFNANESFNSRLDILWVIDNSGSMSQEQVKIRDGFVSFANQYMQPTWDIRLAVITTDTYLAHPTFANYRNSIAANTGNFASNYVNGIASGGIPGRTNPTSDPNPAWANLYTWDAGTNRWRMPAGGLTLQQMRPNYSANWAKLLDIDPATGKGNHDGPAVVLCQERASGQLPAPLGSPTFCHIRDDIHRVAPPVNTGPDHCVTPGAGEAAVSQCVNTGLNDSVHSGKSIISTFGANQNQLISDFITNATVGIVGAGIEQGMNSVLQLLTDNEPAGSTTAFFRKDSLRLIIFVSDEEDISIVYPTNGNQSTPTQYFTTGAACNKTVGTYSYQISRCPNPALTAPTVGAAITPAAMKSQLDQFFSALDGTQDNPNYFIATITALTAATVQQSGDQATNLLALGQLVGNGSLALEIESNDYTPLLDAIGQVIVQKKGVFTLSRAPTEQEDMIVTLIKASGLEIPITYNQFTVSGNTLTITDQALVLSFAQGDQITVNYQPKTAY